MNKFTPEKYIDEITARYIVSEKDLNKLRAGTDLLEKAFGKYYWSDIVETLSWYYTKKNDKTRPTIAQMLDALNIRHIEPADPEPEPEISYKLPTTGLWSITTTFNKLIQVLVDGGVIPNEHGEYINIRSLVDPKTDLVILNPLQWLKWQLADAKEARPDIFATTPTKTFLEDLALAIQNKLIVFKVRDWSKKVKDTK